MVTSNKPFIITITIIIARFEVKGGRLVGDLGFFQRSEEPPEGIDQPHPYSIARMRLLGY